MTATTPIPTLKKRRHGPYGWDFGRFRRPLDALCSFWPCPSLFGACCLFAGINGSTRCYVRWVIHGTNRVDDGRPALPFWCPTAVGRLARPDRASSAGCAAQDLNILNILLTPGGCATFRAVVRRYRAVVRRYGAGVRRFRRHQYLFSSTGRHLESGRAPSIRRHLLSA